MAEGLKDKRLIERLKRLPYGERNELLREKYGFAKEKEYPDRERLLLDEREINIMKDIVDFGSHSRFHPVLTTCSDEECGQEIIMSGKEVQALTGKECRHFSYPDGDYSQREVDLARKAGYLSARTCDFGWNGPGTDPFRLKVLEVADDASINWLICQMIGVSRWLKSLFCGRVK